MLAIDVALERLAQVDERAHRVIECRIFAGLTLDETAQALGISSKSVQRTWTTARAWLRKEIGHDLTPALYAITGGRRSWTPCHWQRSRSSSSSPTPSPSRRGDGVLAEACGDDVALRDELEAMLAAASRRPRARRRTIHRRSGTDAAGVGSRGSAVSRTLAPPERARTRRHGHRVSAPSAPTASIGRRWPSSSSFGPARPVRHRTLSHRTTGARTLDHPNIAGCSTAASRPTVRRIS